MYVKYPYEAKYKFFIDKRESTGLKNLNDSKAFIKYPNNMNDIYKNIEEYNSNKKPKILIVFDDMIADMQNNEKLNIIVNELFIKERKLNVSLVYTTQSYFKAPKDVRLHIFFIIKTPNESKFQQIVHNHS